MKPVAIVTGSYGYIGSVLTKILVDYGFYVIGIDRDQRAAASWIQENLRTRYCDQFLNADFISDEAIHLLNEYPDATVFHLAADSLLGPSAYVPLQYFENNTSKTLKLIKNLKPSHKLIFASTAAVYAETSKVVSEKSKIGPPNNYGLSKLWCEQIIDTCFNTNQLRVASFRFFNVIGAYEDVGQLPDTPHIVNKLCDKALGNDTPFVISGDDYNTKDGTCTRDYLHVIDVCRALVHAAKYLVDSKPCSLKFNLGTETGTTVLEIVELFNKICSKVDFRVGSRRIGDPPFLVANPNKFIATGFNYEYKNTDLNKMIMDHWEYRKNARL